MKKSKIIVPALGILCLSTAAAVTGTVAWFTASRVQNISMSNITLVNPETGLNVTLSNIGGTYINGNAVTHANTTNVAANQGYLRDGSVDLTQSSPVVYKAILDDNGNVASHAAVTATEFKDTKKYNEKDLYFATAFKMSFKAQNTESGADNCLFFSMNLSSVTTDWSDAAKSSLRIGLKSASKYVVWAPFYNPDASSANPNALTFVNGTAANAHGSFELNTNAFSGNTTGTDVEAAWSDAANYLDKATYGVSAYIFNLGVLPADGAIALDVSVYTWFEGTDKFCNENNWATATEIQSQLSFVSRKVAA